MPKYMVKALVESQMVIEANSQWDAAHQVFNNIEGGQILDVTQVHGRTAVTNHVLTTSTSPLGATSGPKKVVTKKGVRKVRSRKRVQTPAQREAQLRNLAKARAAKKAKAAKKNGGRK